MGDLFHFEFMVHAFEAGTIIAIVAGAIGYFVVLRGTAFAAHALSHIGFAGATGAVVLSLNPIIGLLAFTLGAGVTIGALGSRLRERDVTIGIVLAWTLGLGVLFISLYRGYATEAYAILFGEILGISTADVTATLVAGLITLAAIIALYRPLLFSSVDEDLAAAKGVPVTALSIAFMAILAVAVTEAVQVVGVLLIFALIVTPAAIAVRELFHRLARVRHICRRETRSAAPSSDPAHRDQPDHISSQQSCTCSSPAGPEHSGARWCDASSTKAIAHACSAANKLRATTGFKATSLRAPDSRWR